jgi:hypothetical protein
MIGRGDEGRKKLMFGEWKGEGMTSFGAVLQ